MENSKTWDRNRRHCRESFDSFFDCFVRYIIKVVVVSKIETTTTFIYRDLTKKDSILQSRNIPLNPPCILYLFHPF